MKAYVIKRILISLPLMMVMSFVMFGAMNFSGQDFFSKLQADPSISKAYVQELRRAAGAHHPWYIRYFYWLRGVCFDIQLSHDERPVADFEGLEVLVSYGVASAGEVAVQNHKLEGSSLALTPAADTPAVALIRTFDNPHAAWSEEYDHERMSSAERAHSAVQWRRWWNDRADAQQEWAAWWGRIRTEEDPVALGAYVDREVRALAGDDAELANAADGMLRRLHRRSADFWDPSAYGSLTWVVRARGEGTGPAVDAFILTETVADSVVLAALSGDPDSILPPGIFPAGSIENEIPPGEERRAEINLADLVSDGADLSTVAGMIFVARGHGEVEIDDVRLVEGPGSVGRWRPGIGPWNLPFGLRLPELRLDAEIGVPFRVGVPDFGYSYAHKKPVFQVILNPLKNSLLLTVGAFLIMYLVAIPIGIYSAVHQYSIGDKFFSFLAFLGMAIPDFLMCILVLFGINKTIDIPADSLLHFWPWDGGVLPVGGRTSDGFDDMGLLRQWVDILWHSIAPMFIIAMASMAGLQRIMRGNLLEVLRQQYVTTARAKGLSERSVVYKHALRNAVTPFVVFIGSLLPALLGGSAFVEILFSYPGIGKVMLDAIMLFDTYLVMADLMAAGFLLVIGNVVADILLALVDPRISYG